MGRPGGPDAGREWDQTTACWRSARLLTTGARLNHVVARRAGLSESELVTLEHLSREQIGPAEVARRLEVSTAAATGIVDRLVGRGHVGRRPHPGDRRRKELVMTESGRNEAVGHLMPMFVALDRLDREFSRGGAGRGRALPHRRGRRAWNRCWARTCSPATAALSRPCPPCVARRGRHPRCRPVLQGRGTISVSILIRWPKRSHDL